MFLNSFPSRSNFNRKINWALSRACLGSVLLLGPLALTTLAQDVAVEQPMVDNSRFRFTGVINAPSAVIRSGPSDTFYPTVKLAQGATVTVVGIHGDWLKIVPPEGSYSLVSKAYVERRDNGSIGRATKDLRVRAGGPLSLLRTSVQATIAAGTDVKIVGDVDEYYKIVPPTDTAYLYVNKQYVEPVEVVGGPKPVVQSQGPVQNIPIVNSGTGSTSGTGVTPGAGGVSLTTRAVAGRCGSRPGDSSIPDDTRL